MTKFLLVAFIGAAGLLMLSGPAFAHHGRSNYDMTHPVTVKGIVTVDPAGSVLDVVAQVTLTLCP